MPDRAPAAEVLVEPVEDGLGEGHGDACEADGGGDWGVGDVCEVGVEEVEEGFDDVEGGWGRAWG